MAQIIPDLTGRVFERLTVLNRDNTKTGAYWICQCNCKDKTIKSIISYSLLRGTTKSCGCIRKETISKQHKRKYNTYNLTGEYGIGYTLNGKEFYFDLEDYDKIKDYCWNVNKLGYASTIDYLDGTHGGRKNRMRMHRLIMNVASDDMVDHIFHNNNDNRKSKLRLVDGCKNQMNTKTRVDNTSGRKGVFWHTRDECWEAYIQANNKRIYLGRFNNYEDSVKSRELAEIKYHGEYSYDNSMKLDITNKGEKQNISLTQ